MSRAQRRQATRGGSRAPKRRDPMTVVYAAFGAIIVIAIAAIALVNYEQHRSLALAYATPTPGPDASSPPVQIVVNVAIGKPAFPSPMRANPHNGAPVDGITCLGMEQTALHIHTHLALFDNGTQLQIPAGIGILPSASPPCYYWTHTHDATGVIHIEAPQLEAPSGGPFTLGMFFDVWGEPLTADDVAGKRGPVTAYVNGARWTASPRDIPLRAHQLITLEIGKYVPPPYYIFPPGV